MTSSQSQNPYVYCMNNPLRFVDPTGMMAILPEDPYQTYGHLNAAELVYGIREDPSIFDDIIDDYNTWYDYWHGDGSSGHDYPDQNLSKEAEREVDGLRRFSGSFSGIVFNFTGEYLHDLHKDSIDERAFRATLGTSITLSKGGIGGEGSIGLIKEESISDYLNNDGYLAAGGSWGPGAKVFFNSDNEHYGQEAVFGYGGGVTFNTPKDLVLGECYNGQFRSDIVLIDYWGNAILKFFGAI